MNEYDKPKSKKLIATIVMVIILIFSLEVKAFQLSETKKSKSGKDITTVKLAILYDNYLSTSGTSTAWGFACLVERGDTTLLFDTGGQGDILLRNCSALKINCNQIDTIVISHNHWDHIGGLLPLLDSIKKTIPVYLPPTVPIEEKEKIVLSGGSVTVVDKPVRISENIHSTGILGTTILEQSLIIEQEDGLIIVTGCSHPGIVKIVKHVNGLHKKPIKAVLGGFHLVKHSDREVKRIIKELQDLGVQQCGPSHCTGDNAIELFKTSFGQNFIKLGTGSRLIFN